MIKQTITKVILKIEERKELNKLWNRKEFPNYPGYNRECVIEEYSTSLLLKALIKYYIKDVMNIKSLKEDRFELKFFISNSILFIQYLMLGVSILYLLLDFINII